LDTRLERIQPREVDKFRQPRVWILPEVQVGWTLTIHPFKKEFPGCIDFGLRKNCNQPKQGDKRIEERAKKDIAAQIRESTYDRGGNGNVGQQQDRVSRDEKTPNIEHQPTIR
jgi:hypothetical protein